ncbi:MAG: ABC transporter ATP-binding protein [Streptosporangiaceae bacterium]
MSLTPPHPSSPGPLGSLWRLRTYATPYRLRFAIMLGCALLQIGAEIAIPLVTKAVIDGPIAHGRVDRLVPLGLAAVALGVGAAVPRFLRRWIQPEATTGMETRLRQDLYDHLQALDPGFHSAWQSGQLLSRATSDLSAIRRFFSFGLIFLVINTVTIVTILVLLLRLDPLLCAVVAACLLPTFVLSWRLERRYAALSRELQDRQGDLATVVEEAALGIRVIKAFGRARHVADLFDVSGRAIHRVQVARARLIGTLVAFLDLAPGVAIAVVILLGSYAIVSGGLTLGGLVAFVTLVLQLAWPVEALGFIVATMQEAATASQRVYELLDAGPAVTGPPAARELHDPAGRVRFEGVGFTYPDAAEPVLRDLHLDIAPGETVALVGAAGSGKTTLVGLLPRLADVTAGRITIDGVDVRDLSLRTLRTVVGVAFEEPILISASVRENLTFGAPEASDEEIDAALRLAQAEFVYALPWGLDTRIGEQGMTLSGGQRQRLALARAVLPRPRVLVLDDPLSALDVETEALSRTASTRACPRSSNGTTRGSSPRSSARTCSRWSCRRSLSGRSRS